MRDINMLKKAVVGFVVGFLILLVVSLGMAVSAVSKHQAFLESTFFPFLEPGGGAYESWENSLKIEGLKLIKILSSIEVITEEYKEGFSYLVFIVKINLYCEATNGGKIIVVCNKFLSGKLKDNPKTAEDFQCVLIEQFIEIVKGWGTTEI